MGDKYDSGDAAAERDLVSETFDDGDDSDLEEDDDAYEPWAESEWEDGRGGF